MNQFKRLIPVVTLAFVLATPAFAEGSGPSCSPNPGELSAPPCVSGSMLSDDSTMSDDHTDVDTQVGLSVIGTTVSAIEGLIAVIL